MPFNLDEYEPVEERLAKFWADHPTGRIETELVKAEGGEFIVKALIWREVVGPTNVITSEHPLRPEDRERISQGWKDANPGTAVVFGPGLQLQPINTAPDATGLAQEREGSSNVNKTSALENCETSAIGRALANLGYAAKGKRPSREEMSKASGGSSSGESITPPASSSQRQQGTPPEETSGEGAGEVGDGGEPLRGRADAPVPATNELATEEDWATATSNGLTASKAKAIAKGLGIEVKNATDLNREQFASVINKYLEVKK